MKFSIIIAEQNILTHSDVKIWMDISSKLEQSRVESTPNLKQVIALIKLRFPELPNQMVWGNYLVFDEYDNIVAIDIYYDFGYYSEVKWGFSAAYFSYDGQPFLNAAFTNDD